MELLSLEHILFYRMIYKQGILLIFLSVKITFT